MFTSFSALLAAFSVLISTPGFATNADVQQQAMALIPQIQAIGAEVQASIDALATPTTTQVGMGSPVEPIYVPTPVQVTATVAPNCTLQVTASTDSPYFGTATWTSNSDTSGRITFGEYFGCGENCADYRMIAPVRGGQVSGVSGSQEVFVGTHNLWYPNNSLNQDNNTKFELNIGGATCDDYVSAK